MSISKNPTVSVIMSVYKEPIEWLKASIESILNQTFKDFEFIIVLDEPNNHEAEKIILEYASKDPRIIFIKNNANIGLTESLNKALKIARGKYIARMDADDIALEHRLENQVNFLEKNPDIYLVGSAVYKMDEDGNIFGEMHPPYLNNFKDLEKIMICGRTIAFHPTWLFRRELIEKVGVYRLLLAQDFDFLLRVLDAGFKISNINEPLLKYRIGKLNISSRKAFEQYKSALYAIKLHKQRRLYGSDYYDEKEYLNYIKGSKVSKIFYNLSTRFFMKANNYKSQKKYILFILNLLVSLLISPLQAKRFFHLLYGKFILLKNSRQYNSINPCAE